MFKYFLINFFLLCCINSSVLFAFSINKFKENNIENPNIIYIIKLNNGDIISGNIVATITSVDEVNKILNQNTNIKEQTETFIPFLIIKTFGEEIFIYEDEIMDISIRTNTDNTFTSQNHSLFLMPTANPISNNHFIGSYELFFILGGVGIFDYLSIIGGHSFIPFSDNPEQQISLINAKFSFPAMKLNYDSPTYLTFALAYNYGQVTKSNKMHHIYGVATYNYNGANPTNASVGIFYKMGSQLYPTPTIIFEREFEFNYQDGSFGLCGGFERHFSSRKDLSLLFEIWNVDVSNEANTGILLGLRLAGKKFYSDFGFSVITVPFVAPFFSFVWMPFGK